MNWSEPIYDMDRRVALVGTVQVGAVYPPNGRQKRWMWSFWLSPPYRPPEGPAATEDAAKAAVADRFEQFLGAAKLQRRNEP